MRRKWRRKSSTPQKLSDPETCLRPNRRNPLQASNNQYGLSLSRLLAAYSPEDLIIVKMDIEGAEFAVLRHLIQQGTITRIQKLYVEWHERFLTTESTQSRIDLERTIRALGGCVIPWG